MRERVKVWFKNEPIINKVLPQQEASYTTDDFEVKLYRVPETVEDVVTLIVAEGMVEAVRSVRDLTGWGLRDTKMCLDRVKDLYNEISKHNCQFTASKFDLHTEKEKAHVHND